MVPRPIEFFRMHEALECKAGKDVVYRAKNIHTKENRFIYLFCDVPHLIKTARNCKVTELKFLILV